MHNNKTIKCNDFYGNTISSGCHVEVYATAGCKNFIGKGTIWTIACMDKKQRKLPYVEIDGNNKGAWNPMALKVITRR